MKSENRFTNELIRIVNGALRLDIDKVRNYTAFLADKMEKSGDPASAERLRKTLQENDHQLRPTDVRFSRALPIDSESRFPLVEHVKVGLTQEPPVQLARDQWDVVHEFISVAKSYGSLGLDSPDVSGALSLLMYGLPGTGKTRLARHIAQELGLELYVARLDGLISSYLGSTAKNIRALFDFAARTPCVLFLDEFDAIAKIRSDSQELGELKRVVNSFLQNLDAIGRQSILLAATNHESLLDAAVWRRFTYRIALRLPNEEQRSEMWINFLSPLSISERELSILIDLSAGFSGSDIREVSTRLRRKLALTGNSTLLRDIFPILLNLSIGLDGQNRFASTLTELDDAALIQALRERNQRLYSLAVIADLLGTSKTKVHRRAKKDG